MLRVQGTHFTWSKFLARLAVSLVLLPVLLLYSFIISLREYHYYKKKDFKKALAKSIKVLGTTVGLYLLAGLKALAKDIKI